MSSPYSLCKYPLSGLKEDVSLLDITLEATIDVQTTTLPHGTINLHDQSLATFWQSRSMTPPHVITLCLKRPYLVKRIAIFLAGKTDKTFCPNLINIKTGMSLQSMHFMGNISVDFLEEDIWAVIDSHGEKFETDFSRGIPCQYIQIVVLSNLDGGRDCRIRQLRVYGYK
ncbi:Anaphase-promoting complex subunit APC10/Doc1 like protein [Aduncisulcus paluster]|uniref:Anaphase-promoting complex subunit APC10/Doc1 like protein n=1 Tax=Aduncisulcus paluster TaxID=2918883 RepID=A0ABQ5KJ43_9EUKA|nr:Anaphase-promoting complex subunit APC10/Doc1 like protein [Aduncisulcus paluster]